MKNNDLAEQFPFINGDYGSTKHHRRRMSFSSGKKDEVGSDIGTQEKSKKGDPRKKFPGRIKK